MKKQRFETKPNLKNNFEQMKKHFFKKKTFQRKRDMKTNWNG